MTHKTNDQSHPFQALRNLTRVVGYSLGHAKILKARRANQDIKNTLMLINRTLGKMTQTDPLYIQRIREFDRVMIELSRAKWATSQAMDSDDRASWKHSSKLYKQAKSLACRFIGWCKRKALNHWNTNLLI